MCAALLRTKGIVWRSKLKKFKFLCLRSTNPSFGWKSYAIVARVPLTHATQVAEEVAFLLASGASLLPLLRRRMLHNFIRAKAKASFSLEIKDIVNKQGNTTLCLFLYII